MTGRCAVTSGRSTQAYVSLPDSFHPIHSPTGDQLVNRKQALPYVSWIMDDSGGAFEPADESIASELRDITDCWLVGYWRGPGFEPLFCAVRSYLGVILDEEEAEEICAEWLDENGWFEDEGPRVADYAVPPESPSAATGGIHT